MGSLFLVYGNIEEQVGEKRYELIRRLLPRGEEDGDVVDIRPAGNQAFGLDRAFNDIVQEMGTVSLIPDARRVIVVHDLNDFRSAQKGSAREARKSSSGKKDYVAALEKYLGGMLSDSDNSIIFVHNDDDEKGRRLQKTSKLYQFATKYGEAFEFSEKRLDWQLEDALLAGNFARAITLTREWLDRGGNAPFRLVMTLNSFLQILLQARLETEAKREGQSSSGLFAGPAFRTSLGQIPDFKAKRFRALAPRISLGRLRSALKRLNEIQKSFFPTGEERVIHDAGEQVEVMYIELFSRA